jgi:hypothetical protein
VKEYETSIPGVNQLLSEEDAKRLGAVEIKTPPAPETKQQASPKNKAAAPVRNKSGAASPSDD